jgi:hypothetical protein
MVIHSLKYLHDSIIRATFLKTDCITRRIGQINYVSKRTERYTEAKNSQKKNIMFSADSWILIF